MRIQGVADINISYVQLAVRSFSRAALRPVLDAHQGASDKIYNHLISLFRAAAWIECDVQ